MGVGAAISGVGAAIGGSVLGAGASLLGAHKQSSAAKSAAKSSSQATVYAADLQHKEFEEQKEELEPWRKAGEAALSKLTNYEDFNFNFNPNELFNDEGYKFRLQQGENAIENSAASRGMELSGNTLKAVNDYAQQSASQEYGNAFNREISKYNMASNTYNTNLHRNQSLAYVGQSANKQIGQAGQTYATNAGNLAMANARNQGDYAMQSGNAWANAASGVASSANNAIGNYLLYNYIK